MLFENRSRVDKLVLSRFCVEIAAHSVELTEVECENLHCRLSVGLGLVSVTRSHRDHGSESPVLAKTPAPNLGLTWILQDENSCLGFQWEREAPAELGFGSAGASPSRYNGNCRSPKDKDKHPKMQILIRRAGDELIRRRFDDMATLIPAVYASLVDYLEEQHLISTSPFDASPCLKATIEDLDVDAMRAFVRQARYARNFPLPESTEPIELLTHLNLIEGGYPTNAAVLLFGSKPQRFFPTSEIKCAHFHGTEIAKPIPSYQTYKGTVFQLVDQAIDFVMSKIDAHVGTRSESARAPVTYEIPRDVVAEAIVNAVAHRDYTSNGSVQVMLFSDRLEINNPGQLPKSLTLESLRHPHNSVPHNPLIAEPLYLAQYIERMGTGTGDMIRWCREAGLPEPQFGMRSGFLTTIWRKSLANEAINQKPSGKPSGKILGKTARAIVESMKLNPGITIPELADQLKRTERAIELQINTLRENEVVARVGPAKGGHLGGA